MRVSEGGETHDAGTTTKGWPGGLMLVSGLAFTSSSRGEHPLRIDPECDVFGHQALAERTQRELA